MNSCSPIRVFDFFSGCGGASRGFLEAGLDIVFAIDHDADSIMTFKNNIPNAETWCRDITDPDCLQEFESIIKRYCQDPILFTGCAPCQPFTRQNTEHPEEDKRANLLGYFQKYIEKYKPSFVFVENVPGLQKINHDKSPLFDLMRSLRGLGYWIDSAIISAGDYGVPQKRRRFVLIASNQGHIQLPEPTHGPNKEKYSTVSDWISHLPKIDAGQSHPIIPNHQAANLSKKNLERIRVLTSGQGRRHWPKKLKLRCHSDGIYNGHTDVYGRLSWDKPASGLTTRCISLSNGRFGHPDQDRAISVREAACLQTFPDDFIFEGCMTSTARQIGNAVPVLLAQKFGEHFIEHLNKYRKNPT